MEPTDGTPNLAASAGDTGGSARGRARRRTAVLVLCWLLVLPAAGWAVVRLAGVERGPLVQLLAFTPYVAAWSVLPLALALALRRWWVAGAAALAVLGLGVAVLPRAMPADDAAVADSGGPVLRVLSANLLAGRADPAVLLGLVRAHRVDVLALQEFTPGMQDALDAAGIGALLPFREAHPVVGTEGSAVYARFPLRDGGLRTNLGGFTQAYATLGVPGAPPVLVESAHPCAPYDLDQLRCWRADLAGQPGALDPPAAPGPGGPVRILAGDFNSTLDHAALRQLVSRGYRDAADAAGAGLAGTWGPYDGDAIPPVTLDHVLVDRRVGVRGVRVLRLPGSDHRPVLAELSLPPPR